MRRYGVLVESDAAGAVLVHVVDRARREALREGAADENPAEDGAVDDRGRFDPVLAHIFSRSPLS